VVFGKIGNYIDHPILIVNAIAGVSFWICAVIAIGGVLYYMIGNKGALKWTKGSVLTYAIIQTINGGLNLL